MSEADEQKAVVRWFREAYPKYARSLRVSQSGGFRGKGRQGAIRTSLIAAMGGVTGEADIAILVPRGTYGCLLVEHKAADGRHKVTEKQQEYIDYHNGIGNAAVVTRGIEAAKAAITAYMEAGQ